MDIGGPGQDQDKPYFFLHGDMPPSSLYDIHGFACNATLQLDNEDWFLSFEAADTLVRRRLPIITMLPHQQTFFGSYMMVDILLTAGFHVDTRDSYGNTMLHYAAVCRDAVFTKILIHTYGANPNIPNNAQQTSVRVETDCGLVMLQDTMYQPPEGGRILLQRVLMPMLEPVLKLSKEGQLLTNKLYMDQHETSRIAAITDAMARFDECADVIRKIVSYQRRASSHDDIFIERLDALLCDAKSKQERARRDIGRFDQASLTK